MRHPLDRLKVCPLDARSPLLQTWLVVLVQVADQIGPEASHALSARTPALAVHLVAPRTDPNALRPVAPVVLVEIRRGHNHPQRLVRVAQQHHLAVVRGERVAHLDLDRRDVRTDRGDLQELGGFVAVQDQKGL